MTTTTSTLPNDAHETLNRSEDAILIDVRTPAEFRAQHARGALNVPLDDISKESLAAALAGKSPSRMFLICQGGKRSSIALEKLQAAGVENLTNIEGGTSAWVQAGLPVVEGSGVISIERQVRIAAGSLVFVGVLLGSFVHPGWLFVPGFIGVGLAFAGITDTCGMGMMLARMPWNR